MGRSPRPPAAPVGAAAPRPAARGRPRPPTGARAAPGRRAGGRRRRRALRGPAARAVDRLVVRGSGLGQPHHRPGQGRAGPRRGATSTDDGVGVLVEAVAVRPAVDAQAVAPQRLDVAVHRGPRAAEVGCQRLARDPGRAGARLRARRDSLPAPGGQVADRPLLAQSPRPRGARPPTRGRASRASVASWASRTARRPSPSSAQRSSSARTYRAWWPSSAMISAIRSATTGSACSKVRRQRLERHERPALHGLEEGQIGITWSSLTVSPRLGRISSMSCSARRRSADP